MLIHFVISIGLYFISKIVLIAYLFITICPLVAVGIRRLHDIGKSGWWLLITLTGIGNILLLYWFILPSENGKNIYNKNGE